MREVGARIKELGLTQVEAANLTGLRQSIISNMVTEVREEGYTAEPAA